MDKLRVDPTYHELTDEKIMEEIAEFSVSNHKMICVAKLLGGLFIVPFASAFESADFLAMFFGLIAFGLFVWGVLDFIFGKKIRYNAAYKESKMKYRSSQFLVAEFCGFDGPVNVGNSDHNIVVKFTSNDKVPISASVYLCQIFAQKCKRGDLIYVLRFKNVKGTQYGFLPFIPALLMNKSSIPSPAEDEILQYKNYQFEASKQKVFMDAKQEEIEKRRREWSAEDDGYNW